ncbi:hypothetical protein HDU76_013274 [Blyttiomyces sp. JEL0837]|nr:hypothetical protein HDU76_013274 [Blyttiomyces sp. JEL0837]
MMVTNVFLTLLTATLLPLIADATNSNNPTTSFLSRKDLRIGIIGGGVSGLSAARTLRRAGYSSVKVFESGSTVVPIQHAVYDNGNAYDMDLIYIPALNWKGVGIEEEWGDVFDEYGVELVKVVEYDQVSTISKNEMVKDGYEFIEKISPVTAETVKEWAHEVMDFYNATHRFYETHQYSGVQGCLKSGVAYPNETLQDWFTRHNFKLVTQSISKLMGLYGNTPVRQSPACHALMMLANKLPCILGPLSAETVIENKHQLALPNFPDTVLTWISAAGGDLKNFMRRVKRGYGHLFSSIVLQDRIDYRPRHIVTSIKPHQGGKVDLTFIDGRVKSFDVVIVAARPNQIYNILPTEHPMRSLYEVVNSNTKEMRDEFGVYGVAIIRSELVRTHPLYKYMNGTYILDNKEHMEHVQHDHMVTPVTVMRLVKTTTDPIVTVTFRVPYTWQETEKAKQALTSFLQDRMGFGDIEYMRVVYYEDSPTIAPVDAFASGWMDKAEKAQGHSNIFFVGEVFTGHGVPTTFLSTHRMIQRIFNITKAIHKPKLTRQYSQMEDIEALTLSGFDTKSVVMADIGSQAYMALIRRPIDAVRVGVHPALLIDSAFETAVSPMAFLMVLIVASAVLHVMEAGVGASGLLPDKIKIRNVAIYITELLATSYALFLLLADAKEVMLFQLPTDFLRTTRSTFEAGMMMNGLYFCELLFHEGMRASLRSHHIACLLLYMACNFLYSVNRSLPVMRMSIFNLFAAVTEQNVFAIMLLHRLAPGVLRRLPELMHASVLIYPLTRTFTLVLCCMAWFEFYQTQMASMTSLIGVGVFYGYPFLVAAQVFTQVRSGMAQLALANRYYKNRYERQLEDKKVK